LTDSLDLIRGWHKTIDRDARSVALHEQACA